VQYDFKWREPIRKVTKVLFPLVTVLLIVEYLVYCGIQSKQYVIYFEYTEPWKYNITQTEYRYWTDMANRSYFYALWSGIITNFLSIGFMLTAIWLIRLKA
jgi:hypothetical protein